jgi:hypothetical protein
MQEMLLLIQDLEVEVLASACQLHVEHLELELQAL